MLHAHYDLHVDTEEVVNEALIKPTNGSLTAPPPQPLALHLSGGYAPVNVRFYKIDK